MKNIIIASTLALFLTSCGGKTSNLVSFTKPVAAEESGGVVIAPAKHSLLNWDKDNIGVNIALDSTNQKFKSHTLRLKASISAEPVIVDGKIFVLTRDGYVTAFNENSLEQLWTLDIVSKNSKSDYIWGGIAHHNGKLFVTNGSRTFGIVDMNNGNVIFSKQFPDILVTTPVIYGDIVMLQTLGNQLYLFDSARKAVVWDHAGNPETLQGGLPIAPVVDKAGRALVAYTSGQVSLLDLHKRAELWQMDLSSDSTMPEYIAVNLAVSPVIEGVHGYLADNNGKIFKVNLENGAFAWKKDIDDVRTINVAANALIMTTNGRQVIALDKMSGKILWATYLAEKGKSRNKWDPIDYVASLMVNDMLHIYASDGEHYVISLDNGSVVHKSYEAKKLSFVTVTDKIRMFDGKKILVSEPQKESRFKIFDKFKREPKEPKAEVIRDVTNEPKKQKSSWLKSFKFGQKKRDTKAEVK